MNAADCINCTEKSCTTKSLTDHQLLLMAENCFTRKHKAGQTVIHQGAFHSNVLYLRKGFVKQTMELHNGNTQLSQIHKPRSYLGLPTNFNDKRCTSSFTAISEIEVCYIEENTFRRLVRDNGSFAYEIICSISNSNIENYGRFVDLSQKQVYGKVAEIMIYFAEVIYESNPFVNLLSRAEIGDMLMTSRESISRVLTRLKEDGFIDIHGKEIKIHDIEKLRQISRLG